MARAMIDWAPGKSECGLHDTSARSAVNQGRPSINPCEIRSLMILSSSGNSSALVMRAMSKPSEYAYSLMVVVFNMSLVRYISAFIYPP